MKVGNCDQQLGWSGLVVLRNYLIVLFQPQVITLREPRNISLHKVQAMYFSNSGIWLGVK
jgi:hypothetical protein